MTLLLASRPLMLIRSLIQIVDNLALYLVWFKSS